MKLIKKIALTLFGIYTFLLITELDVPLYAQINSIKNDIKGIETRLNIHKYEVTTEAKKIEGIKKNLSGITYNKETKTLFSITNSPRKIYELTLEGDILRVIELDGFEDTEGITYLSKNKFAIVDERKQQFFVIDIDLDTKRINKKDTKKSFTLNINSYENFGYEGIAFDAKTSTFFIVNEKFPVEVIRISNLLNKKDFEISFGDGLSTYDNFMSDYSGLHFDSKSRHLLFLSDESKLIAEVNLDGVQISFAELEEGFLGLKNDIPQPEGITMDEEGNLFIVSEPNLFYKFSKKL